MARLEIFTLGGVRIQRAGEPLINLTTKKAEALLIYLASTHRPQPREMLAELLWDERSQSQAMGNLRGVLTNLRQELGEYLVITRDTAGINSQADVWLDTAELENSLTAARKQAQLDADSAKALATALEHYKGEFLQGFSVFDCRGFEDWSTRERQRLHHLVTDGYSALINYSLEQKEYLQGIAFARCLLELDPLMESAHRQMMQFLLATGQRTAALTQYETCQKYLKSELGVEPETETRQLFKQIRAGEPGVKEATTAPQPVKPARPPRKVGDCPYRGLAAFQEADAPFYFGREVFVSALEQAVSARKLVAVIVGSSGSGKSSALFAGLLPRLRKAGKHLVATMRPGTSPFYGLAGALIEYLELALSKTDLLAETRNLAERLAKHEVSLAEVVGCIQKDNGNKQKVLLVVDQFEELYTLCSDKDLQKTFIDELLATVEASKEQRGGMAVILITLRADFMGQALAHRPFADALQEASLMLGPMNRQELHMAIEKPAEHQGAAFEPGLVERILDDVGEKPGNLPLLEFTLTQLWEKQTDGWLTHADYEAMGCVEGALATYADQVYGELDKNDQELARHTLVQLVVPGEGTEDTRRIATKEELGAESWSMIQRLADKRLVVAGRDAQGRDTAEVVHETLIQRWGKFREWMDGDRTFRLWQERLRANLNQWQESGKDEGALLAGTPLAVAQEWLVQRGSELNPIESDYIEASQAVQAYHQKDRERRRQRTVIALSVGIVLVVILGLVAVLASQRANRSAQLAQNEANTRATAEAIAEEERHTAQDTARLATSRELISAALSQIQLDPQLSANLTLQAIRIYPEDTTAAENAIHKVLPELRLLSTTPITITQAPFINAEFTYSLIGNGELFIYTTPQGIKAMNWISGRSFTLAVNRNCVAIDPSRDGQWVTAICEKTSVQNNQQNPVYETQIWEVNTQKLLFTLPELPDRPPDQFLEWRVCEVIPPTENQPLRVLEIAADMTFHVWDVSTGQENLFEDQPFVSTSINHPINGIVSQNGIRLATFYEDGTVKLWDLDTYRELMEFDSMSGGIVWADFNPSGNRLALAGNDQTIRIWDINSVSQEPLLVSWINVSGIQIDGLLFSPDGMHLVTGSQEGYLRVWDAQTGELQLILAGQSGRAWPLSFSQDTQHLYSGSVANILEWDLSPGHETITLPGRIGSASFSPDGSHLALIGVDNTIFVVDSQTGEVLVPAWQAHSDRVEDLVWSPDGSKLATISGNFNDYKTDLAARIWNPSTGQKLKELTIEGGYHLISWSPDSTRLVVSGFDTGTASIYSTSAWGIMGTLKSPDTYFALAYSPDGRNIATSSIHEITVRDALTGNDLFTYTVSRTTMSLAFSPDGDRLAAGLTNGDVLLFRITGESIEKEELGFAGGESLVYSLSFSPNGTLLAAGDVAGKVRIWDVETRQTRLELTTFTDAISRVAFSPDGSRLIVSSQGGTTYFYVLPLDELIKLTSSRILIPMTIEECRDYLHQENCPEEP